MSTNGTANTTRAPYPTGADGLYYINSGLLAIGLGAGTPVTRVWSIPILFDCQVKQIVAASSTVTNDPSIAIVTSHSTPVTILTVEDFVGTEVQYFDSEAPTSIILTGSKLIVTIVSDSDSIYEGSVTIGLKPVRG